MGKHAEIDRNRYTNQVLPGRAPMHCRSTGWKRPPPAKIVEAIVRDGCTRWKVENENNNILKTKGYHLEYNFGHGSQYLAALLLSLNLLAFLFHTLLDLVDGNIAPFAAN